MTSFKIKYEITPRYLTGGSLRRPSLPIRSVRFLVAHDTGNHGSTAANNVSFYERSRNETEASAHIFVDDTEIIECIPFLTGPPEKAWHVVYNTPIDNAIFGVDSNDCAGGVELCYGGSIDGDEAYKRYVWVMAYACWRYGLNPATDITGHYIVDPTRKVDPKNAFKPLGRSFTDFIADVVAEYAECTKGDEIMLDKGVAVTVINTWLKPSWDKAKASSKEAESCGDSEKAAIYDEQAEYIHWLANKIREGSGLGPDE